MKDLDKSKDEIIKIILDSDLNIESIPKIESSSILLIITEAPESNVDSSLTCKSTVKSF